MCRYCFINSVRERVINEIKRYNMVDSSDTIAMGISGGKDSFVLLDIMSEIYDPDKLVAITIIEGITGYNRVEEVEQIKRLTRERGVDHIITSFKEEVGFTLEELVSRAMRMRVNESPCTFCGVIRRRILNITARNIGATKTATAHNLDDEVQTLILNLVKCEWDKLVRNHPKSPKPHEKFVYKIKPLRKVYEWETALYAYYKGFRFQEVECPYIRFRPTLRAKIRDYIYLLESIEPGILLRLLNYYDRVIEEKLLSRMSSVKLPSCIYCGEPTATGRNICKTCELLEKIGLKFKSI